MPDEPSKLAESFVSNLPALLLALSTLVGSFAAAFVLIYNVFKSNKAIQDNTKATQDNINTNAKQTEAVSTLIEATKRLTASDLRAEAREIEADRIRDLERDKAEKDKALKESDLRIERVLKERAERAKNPNQHGTPDPDFGSDSDLGLVKE